jgi:hypothetical protein
MTPRGYFADERDDIGADQHPWQFEGIQSVSLSQSGAGPLSRAVIQRTATLAADSEIAFSLSEDFDELLAVNECNRESWDPLMPQFHPRYFDAQRTPAFWLKGTDRFGKVIAARAYRRFDLPEGQTLHDSLIDLSLFYDDPTKARPGEFLESEAAMPRSVSGSFSLTGALWIHPEARRRGLATLIWPIGRAVTYDLWDVPFLFGLVEDVAKMRSVLGFENIETGIRWSGSYVAPEIRFSLVWWTRDRIANDVNRFLREGFPTGR